MGGSSSYCTNDKDNSASLSCTGDCKVWLYEHNNQDGEYGYACSSSTSTVISTATNGWDGDLRTWVNDEVSSIKLVANNNAIKGCTVKLFKDCTGSFMTEVSAAQGQTCKFNLDDLTPYGFENDELSRVEIQESDRGVGSGCDVYTYGVLAKNDGAENIDYQYDGYGLNGFNNNNKFINNPYLIDLSLILNVSFVIICMTSLCIIIGRLFERRRAQKPIKKTPYQVVDQEKGDCDTDDDNPDNEEIIGLQQS